MDDQDPANQPYAAEEEAQLRRIEEELERAKGTEFVDPGADGLEGRLDELKSRAEAARETLKKHTPEGSQGTFVTPESGRSLGLGLQIAYAILGVPLVGFGVGWLIDQAVGGTLWRGMLTILGAAIAVWYAVRSTGRNT
ncbi:MAG: AtpZ/AtpI family protein [Armatimonadetes bacterium]|nr:AtpZ/AtpI family protein [Armatimonadota bacterium]